MKHLLILGGGAAGRAAAMAATSARANLGIAADALSVELVERENFCTIQVRNYQGELKPLRLALADLLRPLGVRCTCAQVAGVDLAQRQVRLGGDSAAALGYDAIVVALGAGGIRALGLPLQGNAGADLAVDECMRISGYPAAFAAGSAAVLVPMPATTPLRDETAGRMAGENAVRALLAKPQLRLTRDAWVRRLDVDPWSGVAQRAN